MIGEEKQGKTESHHNVMLERKIQDITSGLKPEFSRLLNTISEDNAFTIGNYSPSWTLLSLNKSIQSSRYSIASMVTYTKTAAEGTNNVLKD